MVELPHMHNLCVVESPFKAETPTELGKNIRFARNVCRHLSMEGYAPFASHLLYPQFLDDDIEEERNRGLACGLRWAECAQIVYFCLPPEKEIKDSKGMMLALSTYRMQGKITMLRRYDAAGLELLEEREI